MDTASDEIEFRRVLAAPYPFMKTLRDALDIQVNGVSLSRSLGGAPMDVREIVAENLVDAWSRTGARVPVLNCTCGDTECGGFYVDVVSNDETVTWSGESIGRVATFDRAEFERSLAAALRE